MSETLTDRVGTFFGGRARGRCYILTDTRGRQIELTVAEAENVALTILQHEAQRRADERLGEPANARWEDSDPKI